MSNKTETTAAGVIDFEKEFNGMDYVFLLLNTASDVYVERLKIIDDAKRKDFCDEFVRDFFGVLKGYEEFDQENRWKVAAREMLENSALKVFKNRERAKKAAFASAEVRRLKAEQRAIEEAAAKASGIDPDEPARVYREQCARRAREEETGVMDPPEPYYNSEIPEFGEL